MGPGLFACPFSPTTTSRVHAHCAKSLTSVEEGGEPALEARRRTARVVEGGPESVSPFLFLRLRSLQGDCDGSSKQAHGGPQPARLVKRFPYFISLILRGDRLE
jgi:hypothetical protein